jgi:hypothetical protein
MGVMLSATNDRVTEVRLSGSSTVSDRVSICKALTLAILSATGEEPSPDVCYGTRGT